MKLNRIFEKIDKDLIPDAEEIRFLLEAEGTDMEAIYKKADHLRREFMGDEIYLRGIIEFSNYCVKNCLYCGIHASDKTVERYRISDNEIIETCKKMEGSGQTTVVLQSGEDPFYTKEKMGELIRHIKGKTSLAVTLSVGERDESTYRYWKDAGMDRYLLRFETSDAKLFKRYHPDADLAHRVECLRSLKRSGVQTGSGFLIGLYGETLDVLAGDIIFCTRLSLDMIGVGPFIPGPRAGASMNENPFGKDIFFKTVAILRLLNKDAHIPSTTAFDVVDQRGRNLLLERGCNVFMPNATPVKYRKHYLLYPGKPCISESAEDCSACVMGRLNSLGRTIGRGPGHSKKRI